MGNGFWSLDWEVGRGLGAVPEGARGVRVTVSDAKSGESNCVEKFGAARQGHRRRSRWSWRAHVPPAGLLIVSPGVPVDQPMIVQGSILVSRDWRD